jgi:nicotinamide-nucleotide adenylyltransferase
VRGLLVGRFQPFHRGHASVAAEIRQQRPSETLLLGIGSAQESYTWQNPFTAGERYEMIERALGRKNVGAWLALPIPDIERHAQWVAYVESLLPRFERVYTNNALTRLLFERAGYTVESPPMYDRAHLEGAHIRELLASGGDWAALVPPSVEEYLLSIRAPDRLALLAKNEPAKGPRPSA